MQRIIVTPLAPRFCAPRQRSALSPPDARSPFRPALLHSGVRSPLRSALLHPDARSPLRPALLFAAPTCRRPTHLRRRGLFCISYSLLLHNLRHSTFLETFPIVGKKMRAVALGSFRIAWKRFHFSITVYYRFLILSTLFSHFFHFFSRRIAFFLRLHAISDCYILVRSSFLHSSHRTLRRRRSQRIVPQKRRARWAVLTNSALAVQDAPQSLQKGSPHAAYRT